MVELIAIKQFCIMFLHHMLDSDFDHEHSEKHVEGEQDPVGGRAVVDAHHTSDILGAQTEERKQKYYHSHQDQFELVPHHRLFFTLYQFLQRK